MEKTSSNRVQTILIIILIASFLLVAIIFLFKTISSSNQNDESSFEESNLTKKKVIPTDRPINTKITPTTTNVINTSKITNTPKPIPHGKSGFQISLGSKVKGPRMGKLDIDPYDPIKGAKQKITIEVFDQNNPVQKVTAILTTDNKVSSEQPLQLMSGNHSNGVWTTEWIVDDSYLYNYHLKINALSASGQSSVGITLR